MTAYNSPVKFQSTLPMQGVTRRHIACVDRTHVSIHTPNAGSDQPVGALLIYCHVSIHTPNAGSDLEWVSVFDYTNYEFQSTLPMQGVTTPRLSRLTLPKCFNPHSQCRE